MVTLMIHYLMEQKRFFKYSLDDRKNLPETMEIVKAKLKTKYSGWDHFDRVDENIVRADVDYSAKRGT